MIAPARLSGLIHRKANPGLAARVLRKRGRGANSVSAQLRSLRTSMETANTYVLSGDSTRDNAYNEGIAYYTRMLGKASITLVDNAASGQSGYDWVNDVDVPNKTTAIAAIPGTGSTTVLEFSYGINDIDSVGDPIAAYGVSATLQDVADEFKIGIDAILAAKPDTTIFFVEPVTVASAARNASLVTLYQLLLAHYPDAHLVPMQDHMAAVYDGTEPEEDRVFYFDGTHPNNIGMIRVANKVFNDVVPDSLLSAMVLDNEHWNGSAENIVTSLTSADVRTGGFWSTSAATWSVNASWKAWPILDIELGQIVRTFHNGNRDEIIYSNSGTGADNTGAVFLSTDTVPDTGALPNEYEHNVVDASATRAGLNILSTGAALVGDEYLQVIEIVPGQAFYDLTQTEINVGLTPYRLNNPAVPGTENYVPPSPSVTVIDLAASPTQADLDIDMSFYDELEVWAVGVTAGATSPVVTMGTSSVLRTGATDYGYYHRSVLGFVFDDEHTHMEPYIGSAAPVAGMYSHFRAVGFNQLAPVGLVGSVKRTAGGVPNGALVGGVTNFQNVNLVRLGLLANFGTVGKLYVVKRTGSVGVFPDLNWTTDTSGTIGGSIDCDGYDEIWARVFKQAGAATRNMWRLSSDGASFLSTTSYAAAIAYAASPAITTFWNDSGDTAALKSSSPAVFRSLRGAVSGTGHWPAFVSGGLNLNGVTKGHYEGDIDITNIGPHEWDDPSAYTTGLVDGVRVRHATYTDAQQAVAGGSSSIVFDVSDCRSGIISLTHGFTMSAGANILLEISTDNGASYKTSGYSYVNAAASSDAAANIQLNTTGGAASALEIDFHGVENGVPFTIDAVDGALTANRLVAGMYHGDLDAVTHVRLRLASATFNALTATMSKWS